MQPVEPLLERGAVLPGDEAFDEAGALGVGRVRGLLVDQPFDEPVLADQRGDVGERVLDAHARDAAVGRGLVGDLGHREAGSKGVRRRVGSAGILRRKSAPTLLPEMRVRASFPK